MFCKNCGSALEDQANFCPKCGTLQANPSQQQPAQNSTNLFGSTTPTDYTNMPSGMSNQTPRCTHCGYVGNWTVGPILRPIDFIIGIVLLLLGIIPGVVYLGVVAAIRMNPDRREKICPRCKAQNLWTFIDNRNIYFFTQNLYSHKR